MESSLPSRTKVLYGAKCYTTVKATTRVRMNHLLSPYICSVLYRGYDFRCGAKCCTELSATLWWEPPLEFVRATS
ncbi:unnamed protein product [Camellia sinensis]